jgi:hypothetical protein
MANCITMSKRMVDAPGGFVGESIVDVDIQETVI